MIYKSTWASFFQKIINFFFYRSSDVQTARQLVAKLETAADHKPTVRAVFGALGKALPEPVAREIRESVALSLYNKGAYDEILEHAGDWTEPSDREVFDLALQKVIEKLPKDPKVFRLPPRELEPHVKSLGRSELKSLMRYGSTAEIKWQAKRALVALDVVAGMHPEVQVLPVRPSAPHEYGPRGPSAPHEYEPRGPSAPHEYEPRGPSSAPPEDEPRVVEESSPIAGVVKSASVGRLEERAAIPVSSNQACYFELDLVPIWNMVIWYPGPPYSINEAVLNSYIDQIAGRMKSNGMSQINLNFAQLANINALTGSTPWTGPYSPSDSIGMMYRSCSDVQANLLSMFLQRFQTNGMKTSLAFGGVTAGQADWALVGPGETAKGQADKLATWIKSVGLTQVDFDIESSDFLAANSAPGVVTDFFSELSAKLQGSSTKDKRGF